MLIEQQKYFNQINQENHINSINDKKMICPNCRMDLNLKSRCSNCYNYKHNNQIDLSKEEDKICPNFKCKKTNAIIALQRLYLKILIMNYRKR